MLLLLAAPLAFARPAGAAVDVPSIAQGDTIRKPIPPRPSTPPDTLTGPGVPFTPGRAEMPAGGGAPPDTGRQGIVTLPRGVTRRIVPPALSDPRLRPTFERPRWVMLRSLAVPGWGQFHNKAYLKAAAIAGGEGALIYAVVDDERKLSSIQREIDAARAANDNDRFVAAVNAYNARLDSSTQRRWFLGAVLAYSLLDAYIDAHFIDFDVAFENDPALPQGPPSPSAKVRLRRSF